MHALAARRPAGHLARPPPGPPLSRIDAPLVRARGGTQGRCGAAFPCPRRAPRRPSARPALGPSTRRTLWRCPFATALTGAPRALLIRLHPSGRADNLRELLPPDERGRPRDVVPGERWPKALSRAPPTSVIAGHRLRPRHHIAQHAWLRPGREHPAPGAQRVHAGGRMPTLASCRPAGHGSLRGQVPRRAGAPGRHGPAYPVGAARPFSGALAASAPRAPYRPTASL